MTLPNPLAGRDVLSRGRTGSGMTLASDLAPPARASGQSAEARRDGYGGPGPTSARSVLEGVLDLLLSLTRIALDLLRAALGGRARMARQAPSGLLALALGQLGLLLTRHS